MIAQIQMRRGTTAEWAAASSVVLAAGEMGLDTTIQKSKIGDGTTEWASLPWLNGDVTNPNLLHNWDFRNPVNQRGVATGLVSGYSYTFDRWLMNAGVWITVGSTVNLPIYNAPAKYIEQRIEWDLRGRQYTLSVDLEGVGIKSVVLNYPADGADTQGVYNGLWLSLSRIGSYDTVRIVNWNPDVEYQIKRVKLELGTVSTLAYDAPMDHAVELPKCLRFFQHLGEYPGVYGYSSTESGGSLYLDLPCAMRITPTISASTADLVMNSLGGVWVSGTLDSITMSKTGRLRITVTYTGGSALHPIGGYLPINTTLSADL